MAATAVGLDIGTSAVRAAEVSTGSRGKTTLRRFGQVALPPGAVRDGEVADSAAVAAAIKQLWSSTKIRSKKVILGVANQKVVVRQVDLPWMPADEFRSSLSLHVQDFLPMPVDEAILDYHPLEEVTDDDGSRSLRVLLVAAAKDMVLAALEAAERAGLTVTQVDLTSFAVLRALAGSSTVLSAGGAAQVVVDVGAKVTNIVVHQNGSPRFVRILMMGGNSVTDSVSERLGVPFDQADVVKQQLGMPAIRGELGTDHPAASVIDNVAGAFVDEVRGSLDYYSSQPGALPLQRVVLSGGGARLTGLGQRLATATRLPVEPGAPLAGLELGDTGLSTEQLAYAEPQASVPVGLALGATT